MPMRQPYGSFAPACSPATRIGCSPSLLASTPLEQKWIVPPSPRSPSPTVRVGLEVLDVQLGRIAVALPALAQRLQQPGGAAEERLTRAPVGAQLVQLLGGQAALRAGQALVQPVARDARRPARAARARR